MEERTGIEKNQRLMRIGKSFYDPVIEINIQVSMFYFYSDRIRSTL
jgi:hypothetical protein